ncbi:hypothetical protein OSTOST_19997 [Ostertagia ostertagi]
MFPMLRMCHATRRSYLFFSRWKGQQTCMPWMFPLQWFFITDVHDLQRAIWLARRISGRASVASGYAPKSSCTIVRLRQARTIILGPQDLCVEEENYFEEDRIATSSSPSRKIPHPSVEHHRRKHRSVEGRAVGTPMRIPSSPRAPRPPQRAPPPPPPPAENIYETVLPSTALRIENHFEHDAEGRYTRTPSKTRRQEEQHGYR